MFITTIKGGLPIQVQIIKVWTGCPATRDSPEEFPEVEYSLHWTSGKLLSEKVFQSIPASDFKRIEEEAFNYLAEEAADNADAYEAY